MNSPKSLLAGATTLDLAAAAVRGELIDIAGERFYRLVGYDAMPPFLMSIASDSDHWMFVSSTGALTAGRRDPDHALFPYYTDDRIHDSQDQTGGKTILRVDGGTHTSLWEPFSLRYPGIWRITRSLSKSVYGNKLLFEEVNHDLGLAFSCLWMNSERFGIVRRSALQNLRPDAVTVSVLDGIQNLLPDGVTRRFQMEFSTLVDGYKESELDARTGLGLIKLSSIPVDRPEPSESLRVTTVWSEGLEGATRLLSAVQLDAFRRGIPLREETLIRGRRGAYFIAAELRLAGASRRDWSIVADVAQDAARVAVLARLLRSQTPLRPLLDDDVQRGTTNLVRMVASADGLQLTGDALSADRHFSNALFNIMRGGVPDQGYQIGRDDFRGFLIAASRAVAARQADFLDALPMTLAHGELLARAKAQGDPDLERLAHEYLPLTFSRRHGDPSRPWNIFAIEVRTEHGERILNYQGNWRDIFQNWEALALSFPDFALSMIFKFACASTADGYNPYRVMRSGFDWEVYDPHDAWAYIGYWGDHQVAYLLKLVELSARYHPGALNELLARPVFTYANVPYRIRPYTALLADPFNTIDFDAGLDSEIRARMATQGADAAALAASDGAPYRCTLTEKLLVLALARLFNFIPGAGLWMNTQRPEWNDANNALVGGGVSMVTLYFLRRYLAFCHDLFGRDRSETYAISAEVATAFVQVDEALRQHAGLLDGAIGDRDRRQVLDALGMAGSDYRAQLYTQGLSGALTELPRTQLVAFCGLALRWLDHSIRANRRPDGLYHSYNLLQLSADAIGIRRLDEMLEGQVAALACGVLNAEESVAVLDALRASRLYRPDQNSYLLNPDRVLPGFFLKNVIPPAALLDTPALAAMLSNGDRRIVIEDVDGAVHFNAAFRNGAMLREALVAQGLPAADVDAVAAVYERVFDHQSFTGRSGTFYKYEGLGCIYWHMVSKLLLAVQEVIVRAHADGAAHGVIARLEAHYREIRAGIGAHKSPLDYGAIPTDPYSHTPGFIGVQQPGMTGQVKEDLISRLGEMGAMVVDGCLRFDPDLVKRDEFLIEPRIFRYYDVAGRPQSIDLSPGSMAYTTCQVPVVALQAGPPRIEVVMADGARRPIDGLRLDATTSAAIFARSGEVRRLEVYFGVDAAQ